MVARSGRSPRNVRYRRRWWPVTLGLALALACDASLGTETLEVDRVELAPSTLTLRTGQSEAVTARVFATDGGEIIGSDVFWSAENPSIATVNQSGIVTGVSTGQTRIAASRAGKSGMATITVEFTRVARVQVTPPTAIVPLDRTVSFGVTLFDENDQPLSSAGRTITWSSSQPSVATINATTGEATAVSLGSTTIRAEVTTPGRAEVVSGTATLTVTNVPVSRVTVSPATATVHVGTRYARQLTATAFDDADNPLQNRQAVWSSTNASVASVEPLTGVVTGVAPGTARIRAVIDGVEAFADVTVDLVAIAGIDVLPNTVALAPSQTATLTAVLEDSSGAPVTGAALGGRAPTWNSSLPGVATVSATGVVTAVAEGQTTISASVGQVSGSSQVTVQFNVGTLTLAITPDSLIGPGTLNGVATVVATGGQPIPGRAVSFQSSDPNVATVSAGGTTNASGQVPLTVTRVTAGTVTITASTSGGNDQQTVRFLEPVNTVAVTAPQDSIIIGQGTITVTASIANGATPLPGRPVAFSSTNPTAATVQADAPNSGGNGEVTATVTPAAPGTTNIEATSEGVTGSVQIRVLAAVANVAVPATATIDLLELSQQITATVTDAAANPLAGRVCTAVSADTDVVTVTPASGVTDGAGQITFTLNRATPLNTTTVTVTCEGHSGTTDVTVF